jgi:HSP20 family molecular chaperone IbpA
MGMQKYKSIVGQKSHMMKKALKQKSLHRKKSAPSKTNSLQETRVINTSWDQIPAEIKETSKEIIITMQMPGVDKEDIHVSISNGMLKIKTEARTENIDQGDFMIEHEYRSLYRLISLPQGVSPEGMKKSFSAEILEIALPKKKAS